VIANAGVGHFAPIESLSEELWKSTIDTNLTGVFNSVKASLDAIKKINWLYYYDCQFSRHQFF
jgi:NAD(P)-dependent dehydrogenase (short-subunit alcohol dehydrogenase family)